jgi:predicted house-cleaning noncanonical NTP pyrophosphatase (MazG superfamily)
VYINSYAKCAPKIFKILLNAYGVKRLDNIKIMVYDISVRGKASKGVFMASLTYSFHLHCKGEQEFIDEFRVRVKEEIAQDYTESDLELSPSSMFFYIEETRGEFYSPFEPLIKDFTEENSKPLAFFFELIKGENSFDSSHHCGYAIFEDGDCTAVKSYPMGNGNTIKELLADWLDVESGIAEDAVDEEWQYQIELMLDDIDNAEKDLYYIDYEYKTLEVCLAAVSRETKSVHALDDLKAYWEVPDHLKEKVEELIKKGYRLEQMESVPDDLQEEVVNVLISGKGFSWEELYAKIKQYTAKNMRD